METTRVFMSGRSQAVRIPKQFRFDTDEVFVSKIGESVVLTPSKVLADVFDKGMKMFTDDFLADEIPESIESDRLEL